MKKQIFLFTIICTTTLSSFGQFTFVAVSDLHVSDTIEPNSDFNAQYFRCAMKEFDALNPKPAFVIASGDISDVGNQEPESMYPTFTQYLFPPTLTNPGIGDYFIDEGTGLSDAQISWLRNALTMNGNKRKIIVFHHPAVNAIGKNSDGTPFTGEVLDTADNSILNNRTNFLNICDSNHVDVVLNGHEHQNVVANRKGDTIDENWPNGTRYVQTAVAFNRSYRIIKVDPAFVTVSHPLRSCNAIFAVNELSKSLNISVFPNPATDKLTIECNQKTTLEILNIEGQIIKTINNAGIKATIDLVNFSGGVYIIKAMTDKGISIKKFIKQ